MIEVVEVACSSTFIKFIGVGVVNTIVGASVMFCLYNIFHVSYWISSACNYIIGGVVSFLLNKYFTFQNKQKNISQVLWFCVNLAVCYGLAYGVARSMISWLCSSMGVSKQDNISLMAGMCLYTILNYLGQRIIFQCKVSK